MRPSKLRTGIMFIGIGIALLLINMDRLDRGYFFDLLQLWPILLVAIGLEIIGRHSATPAIGYLSPVLIAGSFLFAAYDPGGGDAGWFSFRFDDDRPRLRTEERTFETDVRVQQARYYIDLYDGKLDVAGGGQGLGRGTFTTRGPVRTSISENDGKAVVRVRQSGVSRHDKADFEVYLAPDLPLTLDLKAKDAEVQLDGRDLKVQQLYLEIGAGDARLTFGGSYDSVWASLASGRATVGLNLPRGAGVRLLGSPDDESIRWGDLDVEQNDGNFQTAGYEQAPLKFLFQLEDPSSKLSFTTY